jgi:hypothetical protein
VRIGKHESEVIYVKSGVAVFECVKVQGDKNKYSIFLSEGCHKKKNPPYVLQPSEIMQYNHHT